MTTFNNRWVWFPDGEGRGAQRKEGKPVYVVSGGVGASGELVMHTVLAQFPQVHVPLRVWSHVHKLEQVEEIVVQAAQDQATVVHTLVRAELRQALIDKAAQRQVAQIDLVGDIFLRLEKELGESALGQPGRYRQLYNSYFKRIEAIEFTVAHDDGRRVRELGEAEIVLLGVSRVGKTPLSIYLSMEGWKVANIPVVPSVSLPEELFQIDRRRVVGLTIDPPQLMIHRRWRQEHLGIPEGSYVERSVIAEELREANRIFYDHGFPIINMTDKPVETSSEEVISTVAHRLAQPA
jgi:[pyruvate, water dikinase]-phosphate phosphotransferase / [pyruvate, water dikinase] kinase